MSPSWTKTPLVPQAVTSVRPGGRSPTSTIVDPSVIRTVVPAIVGYVLAPGVRWGPHVDTSALTEFIEPDTAAGAAIVFAASKPVSTPSEH